MEENEQFVQAEDYGVPKFVVVILCVMLATVGGSAIYYAQRALPPDQRCEVSYLVLEDT